IAAVLANTGPAPNTDGFVPLFEERPVGCDALRSWCIERTAKPGAPSDAAHAQRSRTRSAFTIDIQGSLKLIAGKGGVGKTTCAAALALASAEQSATCLISTDPAGSLGDVLSTH